MSEPQDSCTLNSSLINAAAVTSPNIGDAGTDEGVTYATGKFSTGFKHTANGTTVRFPTANLWANFNRGAIGFWFRPTVAGEIIDDCRKTGGAYEVHPWNVYDTGSSKGMNAAWFNHSTGLYWQVYGSTSFNLYTGTIAGVDIPINTDGHVLWVWDMDGIGGGAETFRFYIDGTKRLSSSNSPSLSSYNSNLYLLEDYTNGRGINDAVMSDIKVFYNSSVTEALVTAILDNRTTEGFGATATNKMFFMFK